MEEAVILDQIILEEVAEVVAMVEVVVMVEVVAMVEIAEVVREETMIVVEEIATADVVDGNITKI